MRRFFGFLLTMALLGGGVFWLPYLQAEPVDNVYQAADMLRQDAENGGHGVAFREDNVDVTRCTGRWRRSIHTHSRCTR